MILEPDRDVAGPRLYSMPVIGLDSEDNPFEEVLRWDFDNFGWIPAHLIYRAYPQDYPGYQRGVMSWRVIPDNERPTIEYREV